MMWITPDELDRSKNLAARASRRAKCLAYSRGCWKCRPVLCMIGLREFVGFCRRNHHRLFLYMASAFVAKGDSLRSSCLSYPAFQHSRAEVLSSTFLLRPTTYGAYVKREQICSANYFTNLLSRAQNDKRAPRNALCSHGTHVAHV